MRSIRCAFAFVAIASLCACGGGSGTGPPGLPPAGGRTSGLSPSGGHPISPQAITTHTYTIAPVPAGSGPSIMLTVYSSPQFPSTGGIAITKDGAVWWQSNGAGGATPEFVRMFGGTATGIPANLPSNNQPSASGPMSSTPNGRAWGDFSARIGPAGVADPLDDFIYYATANATQAQPSGGFDLQTEYSGNLQDVASSSDGNLWFVVAGSPFGAPQINGEVGFVQQNATNAVREAASPG